MTTSPTLDGDDDVEGAEGVTKSRTTPFEDPALRQRPH
jgi:hypothetical protein